MAATLDFPAPARYTHLNANGTTTIFSGPCVLERVVLNTKGASANIMTIYDNTAGSGTVVAVVDTVAGSSMTFNVQLFTGLTIVIATGTAADVTICWHP